MIDLIISLALSGFCGYISASYMKVKGSWWQYIFLGIFGGILGNLVLSILGFSSITIVGKIIAAVFGSCLTILLVRKLKK